MKSGETRQRGLTLIELMVVVAITGVLAGMAIAGANSRPARFRELQWDVYRTLMDARSEAISKGKTVLVKLGSGELTAFIDAEPADNAFDETEDTLLVQYLDKTKDLTKDEFADNARILPDGVVLSHTGFGGMLRFSSRGYSVDAANALVPGTLTLTDTPRAVSQVLELSALGALRLVK